MSIEQIYKKGILFGTGTNAVNARHLPANFTPSNYTPTEISSEGTDKTSAHLKGIDIALAGVSGGQVNAYTVDVSFNGSETTKDISVSGNVTDAQKAQIELLDPNFERIYGTIKATSATNIRVVTNIALPAATYRLSVYEDIS